MNKLRKLAFQELEKLVKGDHTYGTEEVYAKLAAIDRVINLVGLKVA